MTISIAKQLVKFLETLFEKPYYPEKNYMRGKQK
jgi:hypothetical protein